MVKGLSQNDPVQENFNLKSILKDRTKFLVFILFFFGLFLLAFGTGMFLLRGQTPNDDLRIISSEQRDALNGKIIVHIDGAVNKPGVYEVDTNSRVKDVVDAAGGLTTEADTQKINLAAKITDGQKIYLPRVGEEVKGTGSMGSTGSMVESGGLISVNTASESLLDTLPGVGSVTAAKIIAGRPYSAPEELLSKKAVGASTYEKIKELITVY